MILLIDNYDSFSYNLYQYIGELNPDIQVIRNDDCTIKQIEDKSPEYIVISPGPGRPEKAGVCIDVIKQMQGRAKILGVCLGHQAICAAYGAQITYAKQLMHGKEDIISVDTNDALFNGLPSRVSVARYHSLAADGGTIPCELKVTAKSADGEIMAVRHTVYNTFGVQFHPESVMTQYGKQLIKNFLEI